MTSIKTFLLVATLTMAALTGPASGHGDAHKPGARLRKEQLAWGIAADAQPGLRTLDIRMGDDMRFTPRALVLRKGETLRIRVTNGGAMQHEFVLGTRQALEEHAALMLKFPDMEHDEAHMAHVAPGQTGEIVWTFNRAGNFDFACLIAGHYQAGMRGTVNVEDKPARR